MDCQYAVSDLQHRSQLLLGADAMTRLHAARVLLFGTGGVGSWCAECLVRSGLMHLTMVDFDRVAPSNVNRQLMATAATVGQPKVEVLRDRLLAINPAADIVALSATYSAATAESFHLSDYDFVIDAIDSVRDKADLILRVTSLPTPVTLISSMGAALRRDPLKVRTAEFWRVQGDGLARALRNHFRREKSFPARKFTCVYSEETPRQNRGEQLPDEHANGSLCQVTAVFGMTLASLIINALSE